MIKCRCGHCQKWCEPSMWTSLAWAKKVGIKANIPLCRDCGWLLFNDELKLSDILRSCNTRINEDNKKTI